MAANIRFVLAAGVLALTGVLAAGEPPVGRALVWEKTETSLALTNHGKVVWQFVHDPEKPKSYFHPLATIDGRVMTAFEPDDHRWHRGLWWSWKYINGVNYWEENPGTGKSDGLTVVTKADVMPAEDFSAKAQLDLSYQLPGQPVLLTEKRNLHIDAPDAEGTYAIDWSSTFTAADTLVKLDRTLPPHLGGPGYGGYAGLSLRLAKGLEGFQFRTPDGETTPAATHGKPARWVEAGDGQSGIAILDHPANPRHAPPWYLHSSKAMLFFSPSPLFNEPLEIAPGKSLSFRYRIIVRSGKPAPERLEGEWKNFSRIQPDKEP
jgi:hypothetical protein